MCLLEDCCRTVERYKSDTHDLQRTGKQQHKIVTGLALCQRPVGHLAAAKAENLSQQPKSSESLRHISF